MVKKIPYVKIAVILLLNMANIGWAITTPYQSGAPVEVMTVVTADKGAGSQPVYYQIIAGPVQTTAFHIGFFDAQSGNLVGNVNFLSSGDISWDGKGATSKQFHSENMLILPGISVPVDILPVNRLMGNSEPVEYEFHRQAGGSNFVDHIQISIHPVTRDQALQAQWLGTEKDIPSELKMVEAVNAQTGALIVKQLWSPGSDWWLYEETPFRRSWRIQ